MVKMLVDKVKGLERDFVLFLLAGVFMGFAQSVDGSTLNNFLKERLHIIITQRSMLEIPRELPGLLVFLVIGFLYLLGDVRIAVLSNLLAAVGMFCLGIIPANFMLVVLFMFVYSMGQHVYMPLSNSIAMSFANDGRLGRKLGQVSAANTAALVAGSAILWVLFRFMKISYTVSFTIGAVAFLIASLMLLMMNPGRTVRLKSRFVFRKEYGLFYWLSVLYGARKQIFITFAPWVLVDVFKLKVTSMTILFFIISLLSVAFKPVIGYLIDKAGERFVLSGEAAVLFFVCLGYAFADNLFPFTVAIVIVSCCYVADLTLNAAAMARATYLRKIAVKDEDVSPTLSAGISIDHIMSMFLPALGGIVWYSGGSSGYKYVFLGGAFIALVNFISTRLIGAEGKIEKNSAGVQE